MGRGRAAAAAGWRDWRVWAAGCRCVLEGVTTPSSHFTPDLYNAVLGRPTPFCDLRLIDAQLHRSLTWLPGGRDKRCRTTPVFPGKAHSDPAPVHLLCPTCV